ncbi:hypothetical protein [Actinoplanes sp. NPDC049802]|uniref:hypothetical protein n=1 Tax=Actinoplanes sp. NPDC049802 TaxID=3154742 RepID=UPI0033C47C37
MLLLAGCGSSAEPGDVQSQPPSEPSPSASSAAAGVQRATEAELAAVCEALDRTVRLPSDGTVQYAADFHYSTFGTNVPLCAIGPEGEYYDVATKVPVFGRARFDYGRYPDEEMLRVPSPRYTPETVEELLTLDQADPVASDLPCAAKPCKNGIHGYQYNFRFQAVMGNNISVIVKFDYITTDVKGDKKPQYRTQAIEAFKASMEIINAGLT